MSKHNAGLVKWAMRLYPPLFFNRIWVKKISPNFLELELVVVKSIWNRNFQGSTFGGTLSSAADPYPAVQLWNIFRKKGYKCQAWLKEAKITFHKPAKSNIYFKYSLDQAKIDGYEEELKRSKKVSIEHKVEGKTGDGILICSVESLVVLKIP